MPQIQCQINAADRVVILSVSGDIGDQDLASLGGELEKDPEVQPDFSLLIDLRHAKGGSVTSAGVRALARLPLVFSPASRRAVVVQRKLGFGMARMYGFLREGRGGAMQVFRDFDEAKRWAATGVR